MDVNFWHDRWESNQIAFHQSELNRFLICFSIVKLINTCPFSGISFF
ncbi:hypothetical protein E1160_02000 [Rhodospirillaceae bacterium RKSG073]|nr:hypothetical protein [Curvivirga aplysinae]